MAKYKDPTKEPKDNLVDTRRVMGTDDHPVSVGMVHKNLKVGLGYGDPIKLEEEQRRQAAESRELIRKRKDDLRLAYESQLAATLEGCANLQASIIAISNDPNFKLQRDELDKLKLGLEATKIIADRVLGKVKSEIDAKITTNIVDDMMEVAAEWVIEEDDTSTDG